MGPRDATADSCEAHPPKTRMLCRAVHARVDDFAEAYDPGAEPSHGMDVPYGSEPSYGTAAAADFDDGGDAW